MARAQSVTISTKTGRVTITVRDIEQYIAALAHTNTKPSNDPYAYAYGPNGPTGTLSSAQLKSVMGRLGYSKKQIANVAAGNIGGGGWLADALQGLAGGLAAVGPAGAGLGDALDAILPGAEDATTGAEDASQLAENAPADAAPAGSGLPPGALPGLTNLLGKYGSSLVFLPILEWLTTGKNWVRVLEYIGGAVMIGIAFRELAQQ